MFNSVLFRKPKRNVFNLSHEVKLTGKFGELIPFMCTDVVPGDTFQVNSQSLIRAASMLSPIMHRVNVYTHFFFVPNRLLWNNWENFITGGEDGNAEPVFPTINLTQPFLFPRSLADYLGITTAINDDGSIGTTLSVSALPFRAYALIWNEYYRDQNLQPELNISKEDGPDTTTPKRLLIRCWEKDYFTSALPWTQRGGEASVPLGDRAEVYLKGVEGGQVPSQLLRLTGGTQPPAGDLKVASVSNVNSAMHVAPDSGGIIQRVNLDPHGSMYADLSTAEPVTINELRRAVALQRWLENNARGGSRYIEQIFAHFGVKSSDARLQRPEFLGGGKTPLNISEVLQTSESTAESPLADMAGHGIALGNTNKFKKYFEEHGYVFGIMSIMPRTNYMQGVPRHFTKFDRFDYYFPEFAHLGEQPVYNSELYVPSAVTNAPLGEASGTFGYQSRYCEYKYIPSTIHGEFRTSLDFWHLARKFKNQPTLNSGFVECDSDAEELGRIFPVTVGEDSQFYVQIYNDVKAVRPMPKHVIPGL